MARVIDFTRQRYGTYRRGLTEDKRQVNEELRHIKQSYLKPDVVIPIATAGLSAGMDLGKGLMEKAAKSKALAGMEKSALGNLESQTAAAMSKAAIEDKSREWEGQQTEQARLKLDDIRGIKQYGRTYLLQEAAKANTPERQKQLQALASMTQGPQYQGRTLGQIAAGRAPDPRMAASQRAEMASLYPQTEAQVAAADRAVRRDIAATEKTELSTEAAELGIESALVKRGLEDLTSVLQRSLIEADIGQVSDPKVAAFVGTVQTALRKANQTLAQTGLTGAQTGLVGAQEAASRGKEGRAADLAGLEKQKLQAEIGRIGADASRLSAAAAKSRAAAKASAGPTVQHEQYRATVKPELQSLTTNAQVAAALVPAYEQWKANEAIAAEDESWVASILGTAGVKPIAITDANRDTAIGANRATALEILDQANDSMNSMRWAIAGAEGKGINSISPKYASRRIQDALASVSKYGRNAASKIEARSAQKQKMAVGSREWLAKENAQMGFDLMNDYLIRSARGDYSWYKAFNDFIKNPPRPTNTASR